MAGSSDQTVLSSFWEYYLPNMIHSFHSSIIKSLTAAHSQRPIKYPKYYFDLAGIAPKVLPQVHKYFLFRDILLSMLFVPQNQSTVHFRYIINLMFLNNNQRMRYKLLICRTGFLLSMIISP
jgi:hypothetical protein